jgi:hypothetical protein
MDQPCISFLVHPAAIWRQVSDCLKPKNNIFVLTLVPCHNFVVSSVSWLMYAGGIPVSQVVESVVGLNNVSQPVVYLCETVFMWFMVQLAKALKKLRLSKGTLRLNQVYVMILYFTSIPDIHMSFCLVVETVLQFQKFIRHFVCRNEGPF